MFASLLKYGASFNDVWLVILLKTKIKVELLSINKSLLSPESMGHRIRGGAV